jgi:hypothetical protein
VVARTDIDGAATVVPTIKIRVVSNHVTDSQTQENHCVVLLLVNP